MNKILKAAHRHSAKLALVSVALLSSAAARADADLVAAVTTATTSAKTDIAAIGALIIGVVVAVAAIGWIRRVIR